MHDTKSQDCYFWSTYGEAEIDLLLHQNGNLISFEFKYTDAPKMTRSIQTAIQDLPITHCYVIYPGDVDYALSEKVTVKGLKNYLETTPLDPHAIKSTS